MGQLMDWYSQNVVFTGTKGIVGGHLQSVYNCNLQQQTAQNEFEAYTYWPNLMGNAPQQVVKEVKKVVQKTGKFLMDLRLEIDDWHGDVLMRDYEANPS